MENKIRIKWLGHSCFKIIADDYGIVIDPYADGTVPGLSKLSESANMVLCSHDHADHGCVQAIKILKSAFKNPFDISFIEIPHDDAGGTLRGMNKIHILQYKDLRIAHFGDIGCPLTKEQIEKLGKLDCVLVPVGGHYTMVPDKIKEMVDILDPKVVIPMHYRTKDFGYDVIGTLDDYLKFCKNIKYYDDNFIDISENTEKQTAVLKYIK